MVNRQSDGSGATPDHIDQIREIILGPQKRHVDSLLDQLRGELESTRKEVAALRKAVEQNQEQMRQELLHLIAATDSDLRSLCETLEAELRTRLDALRVDKVSAEALAEHLQELAIKLKGVHVLQELQKVAKRTPGA
jgi:flagellar biosynthesis chaperone FliJ